MISLLSGIIHSLYCLKFKLRQNLAADSPNVNFQKEQKTLTTVIKMD
jgi:hypothetical protein